jgi:hypothetical protein
LIAAPQRDCVVFDNSLNERRTASAGGGIRTNMKNIPELKPAAAQPRPNMKPMTKATPRRSKSRRTESPGHPRPQARNSQNAQRNYERYLVLARAEALTGDRIAAENYFQHAEHYFRSMAENAN